VWCAQAGSSVRPSSRRRWRQVSGEEPPARCRRKMREAGSAVSRHTWRRQAGMLPGGKKARGRLS